MEAIRRAYSYIRFSTLGQANGSSERRQIAAAQKWCSANGAVLADDVFADRGRSGFAGEHLNPTGQLTRFISLAEDGVIPRGSFLICENADRLGRLPPRDMFPLLNRINDAGITVVFLMSDGTSEVVDRGREDVGRLYDDFLRGYRESARKGEMILKAWSDWRDTVRAGANLARPCAAPFWLDKVENKYVVNGKSDIVKLIFDLAEAGYGAVKIYRQLRELGHRPLSGGRNRDGLISVPYLQLILSSPIVYGRSDEFDRDDFCPPVISRDQFFRVQAIIAERRKSGTRQRDHIWLLTGVLHHRPSSSVCIATQCSEWGDRKTWKYIPMAGRCDNGYSGFPVHILDSAFLSVVSEITYGMIAGQERESRLEALAAERTTLVGRSAEYASELEAGGAVKILAELLRKTEMRINELDRLLMDERSRLSAPIPDTLAETKRLAELDTSDDDIRASIRVAVGRLVERVDCDFAKHRIWRMAHCVIRFRNSDFVREFVVLFRRPQVGRIPEYVFIHTDKIASGGEADSSAAWSFLIPYAEQKEAEERAARSGSDAKKERARKSRERYARDNNDEKRADRAKKAREWAERTGYHDRRRQKRLEKKAVD